MKSPFTLLCFALMDTHYTLIQQEKEKQGWMLEAGRHFPFTLLCFDGLHITHLYNKKKKKKDGWWRQVVSLLACRVGNNAP